MKRVAEVLYVVPADREAFVNFYLHPDEELKRVLWLSGVRDQVFFAMEDYLLESFEYVGDDFYKDMARLSAYLDKKGYLVEKRRRDVPVEERGTVSWWAPLKRIGTIMQRHTMDFSAKDEKELYREMTSGYMNEDETRSEISFSEDDWSESIHL